MKKMHPDEISIDPVTVLNLLTEQCPHWAKLPLMPIPSSGTDHALFRLGQDYLIRLPRIHWAIDGINKEYLWVPQLAQLLTIPISKPLFKGAPGPTFP